MKPIRGLALLLALSLTACASLAPGSRGREQRELWKEAHLSLLKEDFRTANSAFGRLVADYPGTEEGREALFFMGEIRMDPRNPDWNTRTAADYLRRYLALADTARKVEIHRAPEAMTFLEIANQLNLPPEQRIGALQPGTERVAVPGPVRVVPGEQAQELANEVERLRRVVAERDETIRRQREELNRIRNTLTPGRRP